MTKYRRVKKIFARPSWDHCYCEMRATAFILRLGIFMVSHPWELRAHVNVKAIRYLERHSLVDHCKFRRSNRLHRCHGFFVVTPEGTTGPLFGAASTMPFELMVTRRLYASESWIAIAGLLYLFSHHRNCAPHSANSRRVRRPLQHPIFVGNY